MGGPLPLPLLTLAVSRGSLALTPGPSEMRETPACALVLGVRGQNLGAGEIF